MNTRMLVFVGLGLLAGGIAAMTMLAEKVGPDSQWAPQATGKALIGGPFSLVDHSGRRVTEKDFLGKPLLVYFGFTSCPDVCPAGLQVISAALDKAGDAAKEVTPVFVSLDPERDTPEALSAYLKSFHPRIVGLTGTHDEIAAVIKAYRVYAKKVADEKTPGNYTIDHSPLMYLMGGNGAYAKHFPHSVNPDTLAAALSAQR